MMEAYTVLTQIADATVRVSVPLLLAALAGLYSERSGIFDIGLEGKMLTGAFAAGAAAYISGSAWVGLSAAIVVSIAMSLVHGVASITYRGNQIVSGVAINFIASGSTVILGQAWFRQGGRTPSVSGAARFGDITFPFADAIRPVPIVGPIYANVISGHSIIVYFAFLMVPFTCGCCFARASG